MFWGGGCKTFFSLVSMRVVRIRKVGPMSSLTVSAGSMLQQPVLTHSRFQTIERPVKPKLQFLLQADVVFSLRVMTVQVGVSAGRRGR